MSRETSSGDHPLRRASPAAVTRSGVGVVNISESSAAVSFSNCLEPGSAPSPIRPVSRLRNAFCSASGKVRPIAIASPTLCMEEPSRRGVAGNLAKSKRGAFTTT